MILTKQYFGQLNGSIIDISQREYLGNIEIMSPLRKPLKEVGTAGHHKYLVKCFHDFVWARLIVSFKDSYDASGLNSSPMSFLLGMGYGIRQDKIRKNTFLRKKKR